MSIVVRQMASTAVATVSNLSPLARGMLSYSIIWPTSVLIQQTLISKRSFNEIDWAKCARFSAYGSLYVAPTLYAWVRLAGLMWPRTALKTSVIKAVVEQVTYAPFSVCSFFYFTSLMEGRTSSESCAEVVAKYWPTAKMAVRFWPAVALVNFTLVPLRNRVPFMSVCSLFWACFLAYMKQLKPMELEEAHSLQSHSNGPLFAVEASQ